MLIDWFTVVAQSLNFLILVYLLKRFLYQPILDAIDEREKKIADKLASAEQVKVEAEEQRQAFENNNQEFSRQKQRLLREAISAAKVQQTQLLEEAKADAAVQRQNALSELAREILSLQDEIAQQSLQHIYAITEKMLQELSGFDLQERIFEVFISRLKTHLEEHGQVDSAEQQAKLAEIVKQAHATFILQSALPLSQKQQDTILQCLAAVNPSIAKDNSLMKFVVTPNLICGMELVADGWKLSWSSRDYLSSLQGTARALTNLLPKESAGQQEPQQTTPHTEANKDVR